MNAINYIPYEPSVQELTDDEVLAVSGGLTLVAGAAAAAAVAAIWTAGATVGKSLGKAAYHLLND